MSRIGMLKLRTRNQFGCSGNPWANVKVPAGSIVTFLKTTDPVNVFQSVCTYHGSGSSKCRHVCVTYDGQEITTNICMEDARLYFELAE